MNIFLVLQFNKYNNVRIFAYFFEEVKSKKNKFKSPIICFNMPYANISPWLIQKSPLKKVSFIYD